MSLCLLFAKSAAFVPVGSISFVIGTIEAAFSRVEKVITEVLSL